MSGETPIYDATCRDVGSPDAPGDGDARPGTTPTDPPSHGPAEDPVTSDLSIPDDVHPPPTSDGR